VVAHYGVTEAVNRAHVPYDHRARIDAYSDFQRVTAWHYESRTRLIDSANHIQGSYRGKQRVVSCLEGMAPEAHQSIANELVETYLVLKNNTRHLLEVLIEKVNYLGGRHFFRETCEAADIREEHGHFSLIASQFQHLRLIHHLVDDMWIQVVLESGFCPFLLT